MYRMIPKNPRCVRASLHSPFILLAHVTMRITQTAADCGGNTMFLTLMLGQRLRRAYIHGRYLHERVLLTELVAGQGLDT